MKFFTIGCFLFLLFGCEKSLPNKALTKKYNSDDPKEKILAVQSSSSPEEEITELDEDLIKALLQQSPVKENIEDNLELAPSVDAGVIRQQTADMASRFINVEWEELISKDELETILNPPEYIVSMVDGSTEDQLESSIQNSINSAMNPDKVANDAYEKALISTNIIKEMDGKNIRIPGFVVPVEFNGDQKVSSFFLVPYFGACLHMPPPPPNQIIYVESREGVDFANLYEPVWISGKLSTELFEDKIATSAYTMTLEDFQLYYEY